MQKQIMAPGVGQVASLLLDLDHCFILFCASPKNLVQKTLPAECKKMMFGDRPHTTTAVDEQNIVPPSQPPPTGGSVSLPCVTVTLLGAIITGFTIITDS